MRSYRLSSLLLIIIFLLSACVQPASPPPVTPPAQPQAGKTTLIGRVLDKKTGQPLANRVLRLGEVIRNDGAEADDGVYVMQGGRSPGARSDANGYFIFENIDAKEYVILLEVIVDSRYTPAKGDNGKPLRWVTEAGKVLDIGNIYFGLEEPQ